jgi:hypothetical protein
VSPSDSGSVSAGIWLTEGIPDFSADPTFTIPLFSYQSTHSFLIETDTEAAYAGVACLGDTEVVNSGDSYWFPLNFWPEDHWPSNYTPANTGYLIGSSQYISLPERLVGRPGFAVEAGN